MAKPEGKRPLGKPWRIWKDNINMDLREAKWDGVNWITLGEDRHQWRVFVKTVLNIRIPHSLGDFWNS